MHTFCIYAPETSDTEFERINYRRRQITGFGCGWGQPFGWNQGWDQLFGWRMSQLLSRAKECVGWSEN